MFPENRFLELLIIGALALIVVGPKDLPILMRRIGQFVGKMRGMAAEFRASFDELARQSELDELRREVEALRAGGKGVIDHINPLSDSHATSVFGEIDQSLSMQMTPQMTAQPMEEAAEPQPPTAAKAPAKPRAPRKPAAKGASAAKAKAKPKANAKTQPAAPSVGSATDAAS
jgi:sec-independent protein translocase protein TatB